MSPEISVAAYLLPYTDGKESILIEGESVRECLYNLIERYPAIEKMIFDEKKALLDYISVLVSSGDISYADRLDTPVKEGDILNILYIIGAFKRN